MKAISMMHPTEEAPATGRVAGDYIRDGEVIGRVLDFPGGHRATLTFGEIARLQEDLRTYAAADAQQAADNDRRAVSFFAPPDIPDFTG